MKLQNRRELEKHLGEFTQGIEITPEFSEKILSADINQNYMKYIEEFDRKLDFIQKPEVMSTAAVKEVRPKLEKLRNKASDNLKKWLNHQINDLKESNILNVQNVLLRYRSLMRFLTKHSSDVAENVQKNYVDCVSKIFVNQFKTLTKTIPKVMAQISTAQETIVPRSQKGLFKSKKGSNESNLFFSIGDRINILDEINEPPKDFREGSFPIESILRSFFQNLIDAVTMEQVFSSSFFLKIDVAVQIFSPVSRHIEQFLDDLIPKITDPICITLLLRFQFAHKGEMARRKVTTIDQSLTLYRTKLAERFHSIISMNTTAIENAQPSIFFESEAIAHYANAMTRRFTEFFVSLIMLQTDEIAEIIHPDMHRISASVIDLLERSAREFKLFETSTVFLINNYYLIFSSLQKVGAGMFKDLFENKYSDCVSQFIEYVLNANFPSLIGTVGKAFPKLEVKQEPQFTEFGEMELKEIASGVKENHLEKITQISDSMILKFGDLLNRKILMTQLVKRLVLYWNRFEELCRAVGKGQFWFNNVLSVKQIVLNLRPFAESNDNFK